MMDNEMERERVARMGDPFKVLASVILVVRYFHL